MNPIWAYPSLLQDLQSNQALFLFEMRFGDELGIAQRPPWRHHPFLKIQLWGQLTGKRFVIMVWSALKEVIYRPSSSLLWDAVPCKTIPTPWTHSHFGSRCVSRTYLYKNQPTFRLYWNFYSLVHQIIYRLSQIKLKASENITFQIL